MPRSRFKEESSLIGAFEAQEYKFSCANKGIEVTKGSMMILKGELTANLYKMTGNIIVGDAPAVTEKEDTTILSFLFEAFCYQIPVLYPY